MVGSAESELAKADWLLEVMCILLTMGPLLMYVVYSFQKREVARNTFINRVMLTYFTIETSAERTILANSSKVSKRLSSLSQLHLRLAKQKSSLKTDSLFPKTFC